MTARFFVASAKVDVVPVGANLEIFHPMDQGLCRKDLGLQEKATYFLNVGTFTAWSGIDSIIEIVAELKAVHRDVFLLCV